MASYSEINKFSNCTMDEMVTEILELREENKDLKYENEELKEKVEDLEKENEELKEKLEG